MLENGKTGLTAGAAPESLDASVIGVVDQLLIGLTDKVLNVETAVRENTAQIKFLANSVELVRGIPGKMEAVEGQIGAWQRQIGGLQEKSQTLEKEISGLQGRIGAFEMAVKSSLAKVDALDSTIISLQWELQRHTNEVASFTGGKVKHTHRLDSYALIIVFLVVLCGGLGASTYWMWQNADQYKASDIKWRGAKLFGYGSLRSYLDSVEQRYDREPDAFRNGVTNEEDRLNSLQQRSEELEERQREVEQKKSEIEELKKPGKNH